MTDPRIMLMKAKGVRIPHQMSDAVACEAWEAFVEQQGIPGWNAFQNWLSNYPIAGAPPPALPLPDELDVPHWAVKLVAEFRRDLELPDRVTDGMIFARAVEAGRIPTGSEAQTGELLVMALTSLIDEVPEK